MARVVLATAGSLGDLHPYLAVALALQRRGHAAEVASLPAYRARVEAAGLPFHPVRPDLDPLDAAHLREAMNERTGTEYVVRDLSLRFVRESGEDFARAAGGADLVVTHPLAYGALLVARASGRPWASVALAPISLFSTLDPPVYPGLPGGEFFARRGPRVQRLILRLAGLATRSWFGAYREVERQLGLTPGPHPLLLGQHSPHLVLALFSPLLAAPQADWPPHTVVTGFPFYAQPGPGLSSPLATFLDTGPPPLVFTLGSAAVGAAGAFFGDSVEAARRLGHRALLLVGDEPANLRPGPLPPGVLAVPYAPHAAVFPRAAAVVHQGGIGTTAEALRAGRPVLVVPHAHDQPDTARRLRDLGVARRLPRSRYHAATATREISALLEDRALAARAAEVGAAVRTEDGAERAAVALEALLPVAGGKDYQTPGSSR